MTVFQEKSNARLHEKILTKINTVVKFAKASTCHLQNNANLKATQANRVQTVPRRSLSGSPLLYGEAGTGGRNMYSSWVTAGEGGGSRLHVPTSQYYFQSLRCVEGMGSAWSQAPRPRLEMSRWKEGRSGDLLRSPPKPQRLTLIHCRIAYRECWVGQYPGLFTLFYVLISLVGASAV